MAFYSGQQHGLVEQEYLLDDEYTADIEADLDAYAYDQWRLTDATYDEELQWAGHPIELPSFHY